MPRKVPISPFLDKLAHIRQNIIRERAPLEDVEYIAANWQFPPKTKPSPEDWNRLKTEIAEKIKFKRESFRNIQKVTNLLVEALEMGATIGVACSYAGIKESDLKHWLEQGIIHPRGVYAVFRKVIQKAIAMCDITDLKTLHAASATDWKAAEARLKLRGFNKPTASDQEVNKGITVHIKEFNVIGAPQTQKELVDKTLEEDSIDATYHIDQQESTVGEHSDSDARGEAAEASSGDLVLKDEGSEEGQEKEGEEVNAV